MHAICSALHLRREKREEKPTDRNEIYRTLANSPFLFFFGISRLPSFPSLSLFSRSYLFPFSPHIPLYTPKLRGGLRCPAPAAKGAQI